jgi:hypothetical protein
MNIVPLISSSLPALFAISPDSPGSTGMRKIHR